jgi:subtilisin family serine protease
LKILILIGLCLSSLINRAGAPYFIEFTKKDISKEFCPELYFNQKALENKKALSLPMYDWYDLPVNPNYVAVIKKISDSLGYNLRWFNGTTAYLTNHQLYKVKQLSFVKSVTSWGSKKVRTTSFLKTTNKLFPENLKIFSWQLNTMGGDLLKAKGLNGSGVRIAIVDVGFAGAKKNSQLSHLFNGKLVDSWDFAFNKALRFNGLSSHGTTVASLVFGKIDTINIGHAPEAEAIFAKMHSPGKNDKMLEEAWLKSIEWCHQKGAQLVNSSVGYAGKPHKRDMLTGDKCKMSVAGNIAARKGMLIINSAGNERLSNWKRIAFPGDADSVLTVGSINSETGVQSSFSSLGPTKDLRVKPNVTALGNVFWYNGFKLKEVFGTSFSSPLVTGFVACILQNDRSLKPMGLIDTIQKSSSLYPYFDYSHGYGVPRATLYFGLDSIYSGKPSIEIKKSPNHLNKEYFFLKYLSHEGSQVFYQIMDKVGWVRNYYVVRFGKDPLTGELFGDSPKIFLNDLEKGEKIRVFHRGTFIVKEIK